VGLEGKNGKAKEKQLESMWRTTEKRTWNIAGVDNNEKQKN